MKQQKDIWFPAKKHGFGWGLPVKWQGWVVLIDYRSEVKSLAEEIHGTEGLKKKEHQHELDKINREINSLKRKLKTLEKKKIELLERQDL